MFVLLVTQTVPLHPPAPGLQQDGPPRLCACLELRPVEVCVPAARRFVTATLCGWQVPALAEDATLITSELMTNALQATKEAASDSVVTLRLYATTRTLTIAVQDHVHTPPRCVVAEDDQEGGRGLMLVAMVATRSGHQCAASGRGKVVWAELTLPAS